MRPCEPGVVTPGPGCWLPPLHVAFVSAISWICVATFVVTTTPVLEPASEELTESWTRSVRLPPCAG